jgi:hypothetical protein
VARGGALGFKGGRGVQPRAFIGHGHPRFACGCSDRAVAMVSASHGAAGKKAAPADKRGPPGGHTRRGWRAGHCCCWAAAQEGEQGVKAEGAGPRAGPGEGSPFFL